MTYIVGCVHTLDRNSCHGDLNQQSQSIVCRRQLISTATEEATGTKAAQQQHQEHPTVINVIEIEPRTIYSTRVQEVGGGTTTLIKPLHADTLRRRGDLASTGRQSISMASLHSGLPREGTRAIRDNPDRKPRF